jgi:fatty-acyl-CoA synthase/long-chain acyl-CoA synthetase
MVEGKRFWDEDVLKGMTAAVFDGRPFYTYQDIPDSLYHALIHSTALFPQKTAIVDDEGVAYSYEQLTWLTVQCASFLKGQHHIGTEMRVALVFYNSIEFCVAFLALSLLGAIPVILPSKYKAKELHALIEKAMPHLILCDRNFRPALSGLGIPVFDTELNRNYGFADYSGQAPLIPPAGKPESPALIMFTSGTTAKSKAVVLKNYNIMHGIMVYHRILRISPDDRSIIAIPIYSVTGTVAILGLLLYAGGTIFLHKKFNPERVLACALREKLTFIHASPTFFSMLLDYREKYPDLPGLRAFVCGSSNMAVENIHRLNKWLPGAVFHTVYGLTENSSPASIFPGNAAESPYIGSSGLAIPGISIKIIDEAEKEAPDGEIGEVVLKGTVVIERYLTGGEECFTSDGWLKTGDLGYLNEQGYLYIVDRIKDMINRGGEKICSFDVENALHGIDGIIEAAVVGIPDPKYGEQPAAVIRCEKGCTLKAEDIKNALSRVLAGYMIPTQFRFTDNIFKTPNGKIDKIGLRNWFQNSPVYSREEKTGTRQC